MKRVLSLMTLSILFSLSVANAQTQRMAVLECFTSATCSPCASVNPSLDDLINNNADKVVAIKYHVNWPTDHDPMNQANPTDVSSKVGYYSVNSVPYSVGDGTWLGYSGSVTQNLINQWSAVESPVEMRITSFLNDTQDTMSIVVMGRALSNVESNHLKLNVSVIEKTMTYNSAPGTNGERVFHNVMKKLLPRPGGESIPALNTGDYFAFKYTWALNYVFDINELTAVAWLQDGTAKTMYQGCKETDSFQPFYSKQAQISSVYYMKESLCSGVISPDIIVDNVGSETINTLTINVLNNGTIVKTIDWTGNIPFGGSAKIDLGEVSFDVEEDDNIYIEIALINGAPDDYATATYTYEAHKAALVINKSFKLMLRTSNEPEFITWEIVDANSGDVVLNGGPYDEPNKIYTEEFNLENDGCYVLNVYDGGNNGNGTGNTSFSVKAGNKTLFTCNSFTNIKSNDISYGQHESIGETTDNNIAIYPNPTNGLLTIDTDECGYVELYNIAGQIVFNQKFEGKTVLNISEFEKGTYLMVVTGKAGEISRQVIVLQ